MRDERQVAQLTVRRVLTELHASLRALRRQPGSSLLIALTIGVAAGPLVVALALATPPTLAARGVASPERLVRIGGTVGRSGPAAPIGQLSFPEYAFVANGLPADFLARFTAARDELEGGLGVRAAHIGQHIGARAGLKVQMRRGRRALDRIDAVVRASFDGDEATLATWRFAKRAHQLPGGSTTRTTDTQEVQLAA